MGTSTSIFELYKPDQMEVGGIWSTQWNLNLDKLDAIFDKFVVDTDGITVMDGAIVYY